MGIEKKGGWGRAAEVRGAEEEETVQGRDAEEPRCVLYFVGSEESLRISGGEKT